MDPINYLPLQYRSVPDTSLLTDQISSWTNDSTNCSAHNYTSYRHDVPIGSAYTSMLSSFASMVGSALIILSFVLWKDLRTVARAILVFLAIADFMTGVGYLFGSGVYIHYEVVRNGSLDQTYTTLCKTQSFLTTFFPISSFLWTTHLAVYLFVAIVLRKIQLARRLMILFHVVAWGIPIAICLPAVVTGNLGSADSRSSVSWCWVTLNSNVTEEEVTRTLAKYYGFEFLCGKFWEISACVISLVLCITVKIVLTTRKKQQGMTESIKYGYISVERRMQEAFLQIDQKLIWIPLVFILLRFWGTLRFFISLSPSCHVYECNWITIDHSCEKALYNRGLIFLQSISDPGQGWSNALLYVVFHRKIAQRLFPCVFVCGAKIEAFLMRHCCLSCRRRRQQREIQGRTQTQNDKDPLVMNDSIKSSSRDGGSTRHHSPPSYNSNQEGSPPFLTSSGSYSNSYTPRHITPDAASINER